MSSPKDRTRNNLLAPPPSDSTLLVETPIAGVERHAFGSGDLPLEGGMRLELHRERDRPGFDWAIAVFTQQGEKLGYIPPRQSLIPARLLDGGFDVYGRIESIHVPTVDYGAQAVGPAPRIDIAVFLRDPVAERDDG